MLAGDDFKKILSDLVLGILDNMMVPDLLLTVQCSLLSSYLTKTSMLFCWNTDGRLTMLDNDLFLKTFKTMSGN